MMSFSVHSPAGMMSETERKTKIETDERLYEQHEYTVRDIDNVVRSSIRPGLFSLHTQIR